eukprot:TRINITY_DN3269_c0_g1_i3.p2 TRINITY_DN3269_c0_g1~~TRINITY_DN3269_c0_g1_i3.p2  ORF type:complete len:123 (+),score=5.77 TRINITY_DN3269_c0_g1_i3:132-500(+)
MSIAINFFVKIFFVVYGGVLLFYELYETFVLYGGVLLFYELYETRQQLQQLICRCIFYICLSIGCLLQQIFLLRYFLCCMEEFYYFMNCMKLGNNCNNQFAGVFFIFVSVYCRIKYEKILNC